jgi:hypothetical protein
MGENRDDAMLLEVIGHLEQGMSVIKRAQADSESQLDKRALAVAATYLETAQLWLANARPE